MYYVCMYVCIYTLCMNIYIYIYIYIYVCVCSTMAELRKKAQLPCRRENSVQQEHRENLITGDS